MTVSILTTGKQSLLSMIQDAATEIGLPSPSFVASNMDNSAAQFLALANRNGEEIAAMSGTWGGWPELRKEYVFTIYGGLDHYKFPTDIQYLIPETGWSRTYRWQLLGPLEAQEWQVLKSGISPTGPRTRYRIMQGQIYFDPPPCQDQEIVFEYYSNTWCQNSLGVGKARFTDDTDTFMLPDNLMVLGLKWRMLRAKGLDYGQEFKEWERACERSMSRAGSARNLPINAQSARGINLLNSRNVPDTGFGS
jgi:hypothetical protein